MYSYAEQVEMLKPIKLKEGQSLRFDCPFCGGNNTFGISRDNGVLSWGCFRASCGCKGKSTIGYTRDGIKIKLSHGGNIWATSQETVIKIPEPLLDISSNEDVLSWLATVNSLQAYKQGLVDITFSPSEDRVMFKIPDTNGYIGRRLSKAGVSFGIGPKWKKFGDTSSIFRCGLS